MNTANKNNEKSPKADVSVFLHVHRFETLLIHYNTVIIVLMDRNIFFEILHYVFMFCRLDQKSHEVNIWA